ncbi:GNAT family N-acetyltransferase [Microbispora sp. H10830]|uniref:GNAT family N-acetyltransferase n=1 Tax=Microbispora sp. H10830 TaxID=2729109 RepID=UPI0016012B58|nr:GNAT family N-acetyltransferase [Microbispora sp. H10830]
MTEVRTVRADEVASLYKLWARAFTASHIVPLYEQDEGRLGRTFVAADATGLLAVVYWLPREVRDARGGVQRVGCLSSVATRPDARGRGLVRRLLATAADAMTAAGCAWSLLFTGTPGVYAGSGWRVFDRPRVDGRFAAAAPADPGWTVGPAGLGDWPVLAALHDRHDDGRPLTTVRSARDWTGRVPVWYGPPHEILLVREHGTPMAYAVVDWNAGDVVEVALAADRAAAPLLRAVAAEAGARGVRPGRLRAPLDPPVRAALPLLFEEWERRGEQNGMARPLLLEEPEVRAVVEHPRAVHWTADYF